MTTRVIVKNADEQARPIKLELLDNAGAPTPAILEAGEARELYIHATRSLLITELETVVSPGRARKDIEQFFAFEHLPQHLQVVSRPFGQLAQHVLDTLPDNREREKALDALLVAKDAAVRALVAKG